MLKEQMKVKNSTGVQTKNKTSHNAITLIALVITIIILLILAGVTLSFVFNKNGLIDNSQKSVSEYNKQEATEKLNLIITKIQMETYAQNKRMATLEELANELYEDEQIQYVETKAKEIATIVSKIDIGDAKSIFTKLKDYPYEFEINSYLQLASIDGVKIATTPNEEDTNNSIYSTSEQIIGTWIDNKPIYRKVINFSENITNYGDVCYFRKDYINDVDSIINSGGYFCLNERKIEFGASEINWNGIPSFHSYAQVHNNKLELYILYRKENYSNNPITGSVWLEYTKTVNSNS